MRSQFNGFLEDIPRQERVQVTDFISHMLEQPEVWTDVKFKKILWLCGNQLRNVLSQHDHVKNDPDPHYAKLPPSTAEALRRPIETWNIVALGDPVLSALDSKRLGPQELLLVNRELTTVLPILRAALEDRRITSVEAAQQLSANLKAIDGDVSNINTKQAKALAEGTFDNLVIEIMRSSLIAAQELTNPKSKEAERFASEYKSGIYKKLGEATVVGVAATALTMLYFVVPFFEFVVAQSPHFKDYLAIAFQNQQLSQLIEFVRSASCAAGGTKC